MSIGLASLVFFIFMDKNMRKRKVLNDLIKTMKSIYLPDKSKNRESDLIRTSDTLIDHGTKGKRSEQESEDHKKFEKLLKDTNDVLFYLSNIEY